MLTQMSLIAGRQRNVNGVPTSLADLGYNVRISGSLLLLVGVQARRVLQSRKPARPLALPGRRP